MEKNETTHETGRGQGTARMRAEIDGIRAEIVALKDERDEIAAAPAAREEIVKHIGATLDHVHAEWAERLTPGGLVQANFSSGELERFLLRPEALVILCRPQIQTWLIERAEAALAASPAGLPAPERAKKLQELDAQRLDLEQREEEAITQAETDGFAIPRRPDADPRAVLSIGG